MTRTLAAIALIALPLAGLAAEYQLETLNEELDGPWCVAFLPEGEFLISEKAGRLQRLAQSGKAVAEIKGVPEVYHASQGGLFDVMLHPEFSTNKQIYLSYAEGPAGRNATVVARARLIGDQLLDLKVIFRSAPRKDTPVHYGGRMIFLQDGTLLLSTGDGFDYREAAQDLKSQLGKIIRMNDDGSPAKGNPFPQSPYVWSYGHRNPQGLAISRAGIVYQHEHGPRGGDEINIIKRGVNYGWPVITHGVDYNGAIISPFTEYKGMSQPQHYWTPSIAPSGLAVYEGTQFPQWNGDLFVGALVDRNVRRIRFKNGYVISEQLLFAELDARIRDIREGPDGYLYILTDGSPAKLIRVVPSR